MKPIITIFCGSKVTINESLKRGIETLILSLGDSFKYCYGGGNQGLMGELNRVCVENRYYTIGVNCLRWMDDGDKQLNEVHYFEGIIERQNKLIDMGDVYVVLPGGVGTIYESLQCITLNDVKEENKPVFFLNTNNYFNSLFDMLEYGRSVGTITKTNEQLNIIVKDDASELAEEIKKYFSEY